MYSIAGNCVISFLMLLLYPDMQLIRAQETVASAKKNPGVLFVINRTPGLPEESMRQYCFFRRIEHIRGICNSIEKKTGIVSRNKRHIEGTCPLNKMRCLNTGRGRQSGGSDLWSPGEKVQTPKREETIE